MTGPATGDASMSVLRANLLALAWIPLSGALAIIPFALLHGTARLNAALPTNLPLVVTLLLGGILAHELLHAAGFRLFGRAPRSAVRIGFQRRTLTPFASCSAPVTAGAYRAAALLPALVLGALPLVVGWVTASGALVFWGWLMLALAGGDLAAVWAIRSVPGGAAVLDHPSRVGCRLAPPAS